MIINNNKVLIQIPKCGTMTTMFIAKKHKEKKGYIIFKKKFVNIHARYDQGISRNLIHPKMDVYIFTRNPYDRIASGFFYKKVNSNTKITPKLKRRMRNRFRNFVLNQLPEIYNEARQFDKNNKRRHYFYRTQYDYIRGCPRNKLHVYKMDDKRSFLIGLNRFFDLDIPSVDVLPKKHKSFGISSYNDFYTPEMIEVINKLYRKDFEFFGYPMRNRSNKSIHDIDSIQIIIISIIVFILIQYY
jgi:hypothetical protein